MKNLVIFILVISLLFGLAGSAFASDSEPAADQSEAAGEPVYLTGDYDAEQTELLGKIYGILVFFVVVVLCYFSYKFLRMFF